jgi:hypothetical protein
VARAAPSFHTPLCKEEDMKYPSIFLTIILCLTLLGCSGERKNMVEGTWRLVSGKQKTADTTVDYSKAQRMKMIYENHFAFVGRYVHDSDTLDSYGGGTYTLEEGSNYTESIDYHSYRSAVGEVVPFEVEVKNDTLILKGPRKTGKYQDTNWGLHEVWVRMK